ncbi:MAG: hypothetical protein ACOX1N_05200 [Candidatus Methanomethylophilaceae archaeon]|jgi:epoxyqueuosine reductase
MADITLFNELKQLAEAEGMDLFGVVDANCFLDEKYTGKKPQDFFENIRSVVLLAAAVHNGAVEPLPAGRAEYTNTLMSATAFLRVAAYKVARRIEKKGFLASIVPNEGSEFGYWYADKETLLANLSIKWAV